MIRVGLIGYGYASQTFHAPLIEATPGLELAAVASSDPAKVRAERPAVQVHADPGELIARARPPLSAWAPPARSGRPAGRCR